MPPIKSNVCLASMSCADGFSPGFPNCTFPKRYGMHMGYWWTCHPVSHQQASSSLREQWGCCAGGACGHWPGGAKPSFQDTLCKAPTMATRHVVTIQPGFSAPPQPSKWHTGKLDCMSDCGVCICGAFCYPCLGCQVANAMDEFCLCGGSVAMRTLYRTRYNIPGSILGDFCSVLCCPMCSLCQLKRDIDYRKEQRTF
ncbi:placenta-specific gene 8 protein-like isoform X2 [Lagopus muta]|uniref:placenta-specific gene 8 protein-like isoform X2 n=1 Tax=Lagopus muta TaxID=64668 RepID=UPI0020A121DE|nr:placenta-specific gene 8 protein-like isoform X2 [Lagopus muta]